MLLGSTEERQYPYVIMDVARKHRGSWMLLGSTEERQYPYVIMDVARNHQ